MHTNCIDGLFKMLLQFYADVIGVEDGVFGDTDEALFTQHKDINIRLEDYSEVAVEGRDVADGFGAVVFEGVSAVVAFGND